MDDSKSPDIANRHPEADFLVQLFDFLNAAEFDYCVLRNYDRLPFNAGASDVDILCDTEVPGCLEKAVADLADGLGLKSICRYRALGFVALCFCNPTKKFGLHLDFYNQEAHRGIAFCDTGLKLRHAFFVNRVRVAARHEASFSALLKEALANGRSRKNYSREARKAYIANRDYFFSQLVKYFGKSAALKWDNYFRFKPGSRNLAAVSRAARKGLLLTGLLRHPVETVKKKLQYICLRYKRVFAPIGFAVAFIGPDGAGKSTIIEEVCPVIEAALHVPVRREHLRPNLLPSLARLAGKKVAEPGQPVPNPHGSSSSGSVGSLLRLLYYCLDYICGFWFKVYPDMVRKPCLYVFDRYFYDFSLDPRRSRIRLPRGLIGALGILIPEPGLVLCLGADPEIIHARKPELDLDEIKRQVKGLREYCRQNSRAVWIDTGCPVEESVRRALAAIVEKMAARYA